MLSLWLSLCNLYCGVFFMCHSYYSKNILGKKKLLSLLLPAMLLHIKGKPEIHRQRKQSLQELNVRFVHLYCYNLCSFHLKNCTFTLSYLSQKPFEANVKTRWISIFWCDTSKLLMLLCKLLIFLFLFIYFTLRFYTAGIYRGRQGKNFTAQGNKLSKCAHDNKHSEKDGGSLHISETARSQTLFISRDATFTVPVVSQSHKVNSCNALLSW